MISYRHWARFVSFVPVVLTAVGCGAESGNVESEPGVATAALVPSLDERTRAAVVKERSFDGLDDRVTVPHRPAFDLGAGNFTMETWVKLAAGNTDYIPLLSKRLYHGDGFLFAYYGGKLLLQMNGVNLFSEAVSESSLRNGQYHHVSITRQGTLISFFVDGQLRGTAQSGRGIVSSAPLLIGRDNDNPQSLKGAIGDVRLWNTAKPSGYIAAAAQLSYTVTDEAGLIGWWNPNLTEKQVMRDLSVAGATGYLGSVASSTDAQDPKAANRPPAVIDLTPPSQRRLEGDECKDILVDGVVEPLLVTSRSAAASEVKNYFCKSDMENLKKSLTLNGKMSLPIKGIPVALESNKNYTSDWARAQAFCSSSSEVLSTEEAFSWVGTTVSTEVVKAWSACVGTLNASQVLIGATELSGDKARVTLRLRKQVILPEQQPTLINAVRFEGGICAGALEVGSALEVVDKASTCTRDPADELNVTISTNHGVFVYSVPPVKRGTAYATGAVERTTVYNGTKQADLSVGSRSCPFGCSGSFLDGTMYPDPGFQFTNCWWQDLANYGNVSEARCNWDGSYAAYHIKRNGNHSAHFRFFASQSKTEKKLEEFNSATVSFVQGQNFLVTAPVDVVGNRVLVVTLNDGSSYAQDLEAGAKAPFSVVSKVSTELRSFYNVTMP